MQTQIVKFLEKIDEIAKKQGFYPRFVCDSRQIQKGYVFVALKGERTDGHLFVDDALLKGASLCLIEENCDKQGSCLFKVLDVLEFIKQLAIFKVSAFKPKIIGITGSCGKTSTKNFLKTILEAKFSVFATFGNFNSQIGVPLSLLSLQKHHQIAIIEMGMSHKGDIEKLCQFVRLDYAIISSIGLAHAENFADKDLGIAKAKGEILLHQPKAFYNEKTAGYEPFSSYVNKHVTMNGGIYIREKGVEFFLNNQWMGPFDLVVDARHLLENIHLALALAFELGMTQQELIAASKAIQTEKGRLHIFKKDQITFIDDSYNASPTSMKAAINYLKQYQGQRKIALIGAMRELGDISEKEHLALQDYLDDGVDYIYFIGDETLCLHEKMKDKSLFLDNLQDLIQHLKCFLKTDDVVLIKGSHSTNLHTLLGML